MLPMVSEVEEIARTRALIDREVNYLKRFAHGLPTSIKVGAMIEVPSLLFELDDLMKAVDFVSVGSNDLFQFTFAVDRGNSQVANRFDLLSVPFLRVLKKVIDVSERHDKPASLCGELAGRPLGAMALIGLGYREISMTPSAIGPVKAMLLSLDAAKLQREMNAQLAEPWSNNLRDWLIEFSNNNNIII